MDAQKARELEAQARRRVRGIEDGASAAGREAAAKASDAYKKAHDLPGAREALQAAVIARIAAEDALPPHEWDGRRVFRLESTRWSGREKRIEGVVETVRSTTRFPESAARWRRPNIGSGIVRLLKKDGTAGLKFETMGDWKAWQLADPEGDAPNQPPEHPITTPQESMK